MNLEPQLQRFTTCDRHPEENFTGFCPSCLCERLEGLEPATRRGKNNPSASSSNSTAVSALKAIFKGSSAAAAGDNGVGNHRNKPSSSFFPELRRCKSFSGGKGEGFSGVFEPQRKSCDVRGRSTLSTLFNLDDERKTDNNNNRNKEGLVWGGEVEVETRNLGFSGVGGPVFESREGEEEETDEEIRVSEEPAAPNVNNFVVAEERVPEIEEEEEEEEEVEEEEDQQDEPVVEEDVKTMKDHIDLDAQSKKPPGRDLKEIAGSFWLAASVFSKKLQKWRRKQKMKKRGGDCGSSTAMRAEKPSGRHYRETQSEIADYGFGRRSCDTDPRFSLDAGRMSFDDPRHSWDEPRASWDGYLISRTLPRLPPMLSVVEDVPAPVRRADNLIPVEEQPRYSTANEDDTTPGGSAQTRDYYSDSSSSQKRKSLDRSNSIRKMAAAVVAEVDETKSVSNSKVSPATIDYLHGTKLHVTDRDLKDLNSNSNTNSLRDDCSESFESAFRDATSVVGRLERKGSKKSRRWSKAWNIWAFIQRRNGSKDDDDERYCRGNVVERSLSESWRELGRDANGDARGALNGKVFRCNSSVSSRSSFSNGVGGSLGGSLRRSGRESNGNGKKRDDFVLERNRSARFSPNNLDNGLLRFYLAPLSGSRRNGSGNSRSKNSHSIARSVLRLY
ncbi:protein OCTOPUS-like [Telopea speciosissima]|uniref:protein OCTOPUS-like n=1 Tax=Telopea speciosissima TaxID=54955 RepID=UPI001CC57A9E|nr:protein OCTOPUS-like [Telopea speciosissima]